jgi:Lysozyme like domain
MDDDETLFFVIVGGLIAWELARPSLEKANAALQQGGADLYEALHPRSKNHMEDLPGHQMTRQALVELVKRAGFTDVDTAVAIILAESGGVPNARVRSSREDSVGLFQINIRAHPQYTAERMADPEQNALAAQQISKFGTDWSPWSTWWKDPVNHIGPGQGRYTQFLQRRP